MLKVSVIIPAFNAAAYLDETLTSVLSQSYQDIEVIVVDDGSTDNTKELLGRHWDRVRYVRQENSGGPSRPRNVGISLSRGHLISFFDSDDVMLPGKIESAVRFFEKRPRTGMVFTNFRVCDNWGNVRPGTFLDHYDHFHSLKRLAVSERECLFTGEDVFNALFFENFIGTSSVVVRREVFSATGVFDETLSTSEDRDMWFRVAKRFDVGYINMIGHCYRDRQSGISKKAMTTGENRIRAIEKHRTDAKSKKVRKGADKVMARCYYGMGYTCQSSKEFREARRLYLRSLNKSVTWAALRGAFITLLGPKTSDALKAVLNRKEK